MSQDSNGVADPYATVLADLYAKRDQIEQAIQALESLRGGMSGAPARASESSPIIGPDDPSWLMGLSITDAAKKVLAARKKPLANPELAAAFKSGGLFMQSAEPANTVGSVLTRRFNSHGDIVKVGRGTWGLSEWYPGRSFKKKSPKIGPAAAERDDTFDVPEIDPLDGL